MVSEISFVQLLKASFPIVFTVFGIVRCSIAVLLNAYSSIVTV